MRREAGKLHLLGTKLIIMLGSRPRFCAVALLVLTFPFGAFSQGGSLKLFAEFPIQFGVGYEGQLNNRFSIAFSGGVLTTPNSTLILKTLEAFGTDTQLINIIEASYEMGIVGQLGLNYNFGKNYIGLYAQSIHLFASNTPTNLIETYFNVSINEYPVRKNRVPGPEPYLQMKSTLLQGGLVYGRRLALPSKHFEINAEAAISANAWSTSSLSSRYYNIRIVSEMLDDELVDVYHQYAFIPSLRIALVYRLNARPF